MAKNVLWFFCSAAGGLVIMVLSYLASTQVYDLNLGTESDVWADLSAIFTAVVVYLIFTWGIPWASRAQVAPYLLNICFILLPLLVVITWFFGLPSSLGLLILWLIAGLASYLALKTWLSPRTTPLGQST